MSDKQNLQKALDSLAKAKEETTKAVNKAVESIQQARQEQTERQTHQG